MQFQPERQEVGAMRSTTALRLLASAGVAVALAITGATMTSPASSPRASSVVRVDIAGPDGIAGHGSGVNIGGGLILTARHVTVGQKSVIIHTDSGDDVSADVLWENQKYDLAAVQAPDGIDASPLACVTPKRGDAVIAAGNPGDEDDLYIPGTVVGDLRHNKGPWADAVIVAFPVSGGVSGGPAFDANDNVVGIVVGAQLSNVGDAIRQDGSLTGIAYVVPASTACKLLGR
jgi:S1-C subfamily serine protease